MKTLLQTFDQLSNYTSNLGLKFWLWPLETIIHRSYSEGFENIIFTRPNEYIVFFAHLFFVSELFLIRYDGTSLLNSIKVNK
jgi:hypothetical protein